ncbi:carbohydrate ABC transporter permease [Sphingopyxis alaskensis]|jgi:multiple sugar transport system permease protein|uniref:Binding-protein-dependent transport systems inner membrane component n=1 Tax=Sphingopyxis alaskensis (strain DSM 13593 / LMG 18877 / RB2256) TaxID=317655 RepID=Q1GV52_SPHAL|nr:sugar ABC transporter permease [Sphingopyxis alaskensis]ABF52470.1 binding-protein-dependent transport systems inner membrane component [Sphingopyxis alaskensis RB2256]MCM3420540.1 sugar ABC transporter permease [Sphingopyxis alaskensis]
MTARDRLGGYAFVLPFVAAYSFLLIVPFIMGAWISFHRADLFGARQWIGLDNYARLFGDPVFYQAMGTTFLLALMIVPALTIITLMLALALNRATRAAAIFRGLFFSSSVLSVTIVTLIWRFVLTPDAGLIAKLLTALGMEPLPFLSHPDLVVPAIALTTIWWGLGLPMMLFLAGLQQIPQDMYEAAALDRASRWTVFRRITLPSLRRTTILVVMLQTAAQLQIFGQAQLLTSGGPSGSSRPIVLYIYEIAFGRWELGYAVAAAEVLFVLVLALTLGQYWFGTRDEGASR